jgi:hypothetical protein
LIPLVRRLLYAFLWDANAAERWVRGLGNFLAGMFSAVVVSVLPFTSDPGQAVGLVRNWTLLDWTWRAGVGVAFFLANARVRGPAPEAK